MISHISWGPLVEKGFVEKAQSTLLFETASEKSWIHNIRQCILANVSASGEIWTGLDNFTFLNNWRNQFYSGVFSDRSTSHKQNEKQKINFFFNSIIDFKIILIPILSCVITCNERVQ